MSDTEPETPELSFEDKMRAGIYGLLGVILTEAPDREQLLQISVLRDNESELGQAMGALAKLAAAGNPSTIATEFKTLFGPILKPLASVHADDPDAVLAALAEQNERLGIAAFEGSEDEPADHIAALCDTMASLILSQNNEGLSAEDPAIFFNATIAPWGETFFTKLEGKRTAKFYGPVGSLGRAFLTSEAEICAGNTTG